MSTHASTGKTSKPASTRRSSPRLHLSRDFNGTIEEVEGVYDYAWYVGGGGAGGIPFGKVATGGFDLTRTPPDENAESA